MIAAIPASPFFASVRRGAWRWFAAVVFWLGFVVAAPAASAQGLESVLAPGKLSQAHAKFEGDCQKCHVRFDRNAQERLCMDCHKDIGQDATARAGLHGRMKPQSCRSCHSEHKGREARLVVLDRAGFDHSTTNFTLRGKHASTDCAKCHLPGKGYRIAARECVACHRADDRHRGALGKACADCHGESSWKNARFDHGATRFPLAAKHDAVACDSCHKNAQYKDTPRACVACHKKDDRHKGQLGERCESCHAPAGWKSVRFNHDADTKFPLLGRHRGATCQSCHTGNLLRDKPPGNCIDCHRSDDRHKGTLGTDCARCHSERDWKEPARFNHAKTAFALVGKHAAAACRACHRSDLFKEAPKDCIACHRQDDRHRGSLGENCAQCHNEQGWKKTSVDHSKTAFPLLGAHQKAECGSCHRGASFKGTPKDCVACHQRDDKHEGQEGRACAQCHGQVAWKPAPKFDHGLVSFPLLGSHATTACRTCHTGARFKDARSNCSACHAKDDRHKGAMGADCAQCHNPRTWKAWEFDHDRQTRFALDGKHAGLGCAACHTADGGSGRALASAQCVSCHARDDAHEGSYGRQCQQCHVTTSFRSIRARPGIGRAKVSP